jgi:hypothetical protein
VTFTPSSQERGLRQNPTNQEQGLITVSPNSGANLPNLPVGARLRILPMPSYRM